MWVQWRPWLSIAAAGVVVVARMIIYAIVAIVSGKGYLWNEAYWGKTVCLRVQMYHICWYAEDVCFSQGSVLDVAELFSNRF